MPGHHGGATPRRWLSSRLAGLVSADGLAGRLVDVQWATPHLRTLGVVDVPRVEYLAQLRSALTLPLPAAFNARFGG